MNNLNNNSIESNYTTEELLDMAYMLEVAEWVMAEAEHDQYWDEQAELDEYFVGDPQ